MIFDRLFKGCENACPIKQFHDVNERDVPGNNKNASVFVTAALVKDF